MEMKKMVNALLEKKDKQSRNLAKILCKQHLQSVIVCDWRWDIARAKEDKLSREYLYTLLDDKTLREVIILEDLIKEETKKIEYNGWYMQNHDCIARHDFVQMSYDGSGAEYDHYAVVRIENGFVPRDSESYTETKYIEKNKDILRKLAYYINRLETILKESEFESEEDKEIAFELMYNLGMLPRPRKENPYTYKRIA